MCTAARGQFEGTVTIPARVPTPPTPAAATTRFEPPRRYCGDGELRRPEGPGDPELGPATLTPTMVDGGANSNQVPADCRLVVDRRSVPPETADGFREELQSTLRAAVSDGVSATWPHSARIRRSRGVCNRHRRRTGPHTQEASGGGVRQFGAATEASYFANSGPTVVFGPGDRATKQVLSRTRNASTSGSRTTNRRTSCARDGRTAGLSHGLADGLASPTAAERGQRAPWLRLRRHAVELLEVVRSRLNRRRSAGRRRRRPTAAPHRARPAVRRGQRR